MSGLFVPLEGIDGCGKTTVARQVVDELIGYGIDAVFLSKKQVTGYPNEYIDRFMLGLKAALWDAKPDDPVADIPEDVWFCLHASWYKMVAANHLTPLIERRGVILMDGWYYKFLARHLVHGENEIVRRLLVGLPLGDPVVLLDALPEVCWKRRESFRAAELGAHDGGLSEQSHESQYLAYQSVVRGQLIEFSKSHNWHVVNVGTSNANEVCHAVVSIIQKRLYHHKVRGAMR